jgi:serine/threonine protein kinase
VDVLLRVSPLKPFAGNQQCRRRETSSSIAIGCRGSYVSRVPFTPPPDAEIIHAFSALSSLTRIDAGGFKAVYKADISGNIEVFKLLCLPAPGATDEEKAYRREAMGRIEREISLLADCKSPELVKLGALAPATVSINTIEYVGYSEEFLPGSNLWTLLRAKGTKPDETESRVLLRSLVRAISELWAMRVIHRDIKPPNVIKLNDSNRPFVLLDLGVAYGLVEPGLTRDTQIIPGTPRYFAPEMLKPGFRQTIDFRADLYSAALTVFEYSAQIHALAKTADDLVRTISRIMSQPPRSLKSERADFSDDFCALIDRMLKKQPALRPNSLDRILAFLDS